MTDDTVELLAAEALGDERAVEASLRPRRLGDFVGQERVREQLGLVLESAQRRGRAPVTVPLGTPVCDNPAGGPRRSLSSTSSRCAPLRPIPGTSVSAATSSVATARRTESGLCTASTACARRGPTPLAVCNSSKTVRSSASANP